jgi:hypothetical protein
MIRFTWLQFRTQAAVAIGGLAVIAVVLAITGPHLAHLYDTTVANCKAHNDCQTAMAAFLRNDRTLQIGLDALVVVVPGIIGVFWGPPLVARELETGTYRLAWTQSVTRRRWMAVKLGVIGLASMIVAGLLSLMVTWWSSPIDRVNMSPFVSFDQRDIVPVGYAALAFTLGVTAGLLIRRTLPAMATTLAVFVGVRLVVVHFLRPYHLIAPVHRIVPDNAIASIAFGTAVSPPPDGLAPRGWLLTNQTINATGQVIGQGGTIGSGGGNIGIGPHGVDIQGLTCPNIRLPQHSPANDAAANAAIQRCVDQLRLRELLTYQPASRYWAFQWYELAIFLGLALVLSGFCLWWSRRRRSEGLHIQHAPTSRAPTLERST